MSLRLKSLIEEIAELKANFDTKLAEMEARRPQLIAEAIAEEKANEVAEAAARAARIAALAALAAAAAPAPPAASPAAPAPAAAPEPVKTTLPVFCTADGANLANGNIEVSDFDNMIAFSYALKKDLSEAFETMSAKDFKEYLKTLHRCDTGELINGHEAGKICKYMKWGTENIGKQIVVAVPKPWGGGLQIREITGPYRYSECVSTTNGGSGYFHQFPTELVRNLKGHESNEVVEARKVQSPQGLNWYAALVVHDG
jgi:hypothetical protein